MSYGIYVSQASSSHEYIHDTHYVHITYILMGAALLFHGSVTKTHYDAVMHTTGIMRRRNKSHISYAAGDGRVVGDVRDDRRGVRPAKLSAQTADEVLGSSADALIRAAPLACSPERDLLAFCFGIALPRAPTKRLTVVELLGRFATTARLAG